MLFATVGQGARLVWMMAAGAAVGAWYGCMALLRRFIQAGFWLSLICDLAFGLGAALILILFLVSGGYGQVRLYEILGAAAGALIFIFALYAPLRGLGRGIGGAWRKIVSAVSKNRLIKVIFK